MFTTETRQNLLSTDAAPTSCSEGPTTHIDYAHLAKYTMGDRGLEREILELFVNQVPEIIDRLTIAARSEDAAAWKEAGHTLKGSAMAVGATRLAREAQAAELADVCDAEQYLPAIDKAAKAVAAEISERA